MVSTTLKDDFLALRGVSARLSMASLSVRVDSATLRVVSVTTSIDSVRSV